MKNALPLLFLLHLCLFVNAQTTWQKIDAGSNFSVALNSDGTIWTWGDNTYGQLGIGNNIDQLEPTMVGTDNDWVDIIAGSKHCLAIKSDGTLWSWGRNFNGQLGLGSTSQQNSPTQVGADNDWMAINAGSWFSLALKNDSTLWTWGENDRGQLGLGNTVQKLSPQQLGAEKWITMDGGWQHTIGIKADGTLWAWGEGGSGQLGGGSFNDQFYPTLLNSDNDWVMVQAGLQSNYALKSDSTIWSVGLNANGQLGIGNTTFNISTLTQSGTDNDWLSISAGTGCLFALKPDSTLWACGYNAGHLGTGDYTEPNSLTQIGTANDWVEIVSAKGYASSFGGIVGHYTLGLRFSQPNKICATGHNSHGQLGDGTTTSTITFTCTAGTGLHIGKINVSSNIIIYPNPTTGAFQIDLTTLESPNATVNVYNAVGALVATQQVNNVGQLISSNLKQQPNGLYLVEVIAGEQRMVKKLQLQR